MAEKIDHTALPALKDQFPNVKLLVNEFRDMVTVVIPRENLSEVALFLRDDASQRYDLLSELHGVDYLNFPGAKHRFAVHYGLVSIANNKRLWLKVFLDPTRETTPGNDHRDENVLTDGDPGLMVASVCPI